VTAAKTDLQRLNNFRKPLNSSFRGTLRAEESLFSLSFTPGEIPHFVRNDHEKTESFPNNPTQAIQFVGSVG
jgi:hypothetical protein